VEADHPPSAPSGDAWPAAFRILQEAGCASWRGPAATCRARGRALRGAKRICAPGASLGPPQWRSLFREHPVSDDP